MSSLSDKKREAERFISNKTRNANVLNGVKDKPSCELVPFTTSVFIFLRPKAR